MKKEVSINFLKRFISFLIDYNIPYHISSGTLLGYIREGDLLEWDTDIDICTYVPFIPIIYELKEVLLDKYQITITRFQKGDKLLKVNKNYGAKKVYNLKVNNWNKVRYLWRLSFNGTNLGEKDTDEPKTFKWIDIYGKHWFPMIKEVPFKDFTIFIPIESEKYLTTVYGDWKNPIKRDKYVRNFNAQPIYYCTFLFFSEYGKKFRNKQYFYINEFECQDIQTIKEFIEKYPKISDLISQTYEIIFP